MVQGYDYANIYAHKFSGMMSQQKLNVQLFEGGLHRRKGGNGVFIFYRISLRQSTVFTLN